MPLTNPQRRFLRTPTQLAKACSLVACVHACTLSDYGYLGAKRGSVVGGQAGYTSARTDSSIGGSDGDGGATTPTSSSPATTSGGSSGAGGASSGIGGTATSSRTARPEGGIAYAGSSGQTEVPEAGRGSGGGGTANAGNGPFGGGGTTPSGGTGGVATTAPVPTSCNGCAVLHVPFTARTQSVRFYMRFEPAVSVNTHGDAGGSTGAVSLQGTLRMRVFAPKLGNTQYQLLVQQASGSYTMCFSGVRSLPPGVTAGWVTLEWSMGTCTSDTNIGRLGLDLLTSDALSDPTPDTTVLWLDTISLELAGSNLAGPFNFDSASTVNATPVTDDWNQSLGVLYYRPATPTPPTGTTITWFSN